MYLTEASNPKTSYETAFFPKFQITWAFEPFEGKKQRSKLIITIIF